MLIAINRLSPIHISLIVCAILTLAGSFSFSNSILMYDSDLFAQGQWWRPLTAWAAQLNLKHWLLNQWGLIVMAVLLPRRLGIPESLGFLVIWLLSSAALGLSSYANYVGLSGLLYGWLIYSAVLSPYYSRLIQSIFVLSLSVKVFSENGFLPLPGGDWVGAFIGAEVAHLSHLWGLLSGYFVIASLWIFRRFS